MGPFKEGGEQAGYEGRHHHLGFVFLSVWQQGVWMCCNLLVNGIYWGYNPLILTS